MRKVSFWISRCKHRAWSGWGSRSLAGTWPGGGGTPHTQSCKQLVMGKTLRQTSLPKEEQRKDTTKYVPLQSPSSTVIPLSATDSHPAVSPGISSGTRRRKLISLCRHAAEIFLCLPPQSPSALHCCIEAAQREAFCVDHNWPNTSAQRDSPCPEQFAA